MPSLRFEVADGRSLPYEDSTFDVVVFATTLCHIPAADDAIAEAFRVLHPGGSLLIFDGDYATATVALSHLDPLQKCVDAAVANLVHDPWLMRRVTSMTQAAGFEADELRSHGYLTVESPLYLLNVIDAGAETLAGQGVLSPATASALKSEARQRVDDGRFFGHIAYTSLVATRPR